MTAAAAPVVAAAETAAAAAVAVALAGARDFLVWAASLGQKLCPGQGALGQTRRPPGQRHCRARRPNTVTMAPRTGGGTALVQNLALQMQRAGEEGTGTSSGAAQQQRGNASSPALDSAALATISAAVAAAVRSARSDDAEATAATAAQLGAMVAEVRSLLAATPGQGTVVVRKVKRYDLSLSASREKVRLAPRALRRAEPQPRHALRR